MFILDRDNYRILRWALGDSMGYVVAGGNGGGAAFTQMGLCYGMFFDQNYNIYLSENSNHRVTKWSNGNKTAGVLIAGGNGAGNSGDKLNSPWGVYVDGNTTLYVVDRANHRVQMWYRGASLGITVAGSTSDPGPWSYQFSSPTAITFDIYGFFYVLDTNNARVQKWYLGASYGSTVISGTMSGPFGMTFDRLGNLVIADTGYARVLSFGVLCPSATTTTPMPPIPTTVAFCQTATWNQTMSVIAGSTSNAGSSPTALYNPYDISLDGYSNLYVADFTNHRIQRFAPGSYTADTVAGSGSAGSSRSELYYPTSVRVTANQTMFILDRTNYRVLRWQVGDTLGYVVAGNNGNGGGFNQIGVSYGLFVDSNLNVYVSENSNHRVTKWSPLNITSAMIVAGGNGNGNAPEKLSWPWGIFVDSSGGIYVSDNNNHRIQYWPAAASFGTTLAGSTSDPGPWSYQFNAPTAVTVDPYGYIYVMDYNNRRVQRWYSGATFGITVAASTMSNPNGMTLDLQGNILVADTSYHRIIKFAIMCPSPTTTTAAPPTQPIIPLCPTAIWNQTLATIAGTIGAPGVTSTLLNTPYDMDFDGYSNLYVVDYQNHRIQRFPAGTFTSSTVAGYSSGGGSSRSEFIYPTAMRVTSNGTMFILDRTNYRALRWQVGDTLGYVIAGGNGNGAAFTQIGVSYGLAIDEDNNVYICEQSNHRVTKWYNGNATFGNLVAGGNGAGNTAEKLSSPWGVTVSANGSIYVVDRGNHRVQKWDAGINGGLTVAGSTSDPGPWSYQFSSPTHVAIDTFGFLYIVDSGNNRIQKWSPAAAYGTTVASGSLSGPTGIRFDRRGNLVVADTNNHRIVSYGLLCPASTTTTTFPPPQTPVPLCQTAIWNTTSTIVAGSTSTTGVTATLLNTPYHVSFDGYNHFFVADYANHRIQRFQLGSNIGTTVAGFNPSSGTGRSELYYPSYLQVTSNATMFIMDTYNYRVLQWQVGDPIGTVVVNGRGSGTTFDKIGLSRSIFVDDNYNIYVSEFSNNRVTLWSYGNNTVGLLVAGGNGAGSSSEKLNGPWGVCIDNNTGIYIVDQTNHRVQYWLAGGSVGTTVAGATGSSGPWSYQFSSPTNIALDQYGYIYVMDTGNVRIQKWFPGDPYGRTVVSSSLNNPISFGFDLSQTLFIADTSNHRVLAYALLCPPTTTTTTAPPTYAPTLICATAIWNQTFSTIAGILSTAGLSATLLNNPSDMDFDGYGNVYVADRSNHRIVMFPAGQTAGVSVAGNPGAAGSSRSEFNNPYSIHVTSNQTMFILDTTNYRVVRWQLGDTLGTTIAGGNGNGAGFQQIGPSYQIFVDNSYNVYISDQGNNRVTKWYNGNTTAGTLIAGGNGAGAAPEKLSAPWGIYVDSSRNLYIADRGNNRIQLWNSGSNTGITVAGVSTGTGGAWAYQLNSPTSVITDTFGNIFVLDSGNSRVQKWYAGGAYGVTIVSVTMSAPLSIKIDLFANLIIADTGYQRILSFGLLCPATTTSTPAPPTVSVIPLCGTAAWNSTSRIAAGSTGTAGSTSTLLNAPYNVRFDNFGYMYVVDFSNHRIQRYSPGSNTGSTVAGLNLASGAGFSELYNPSAIHVTSNGTMYIMDTYNYRVLKWQLGDPIGMVVVNGRGAGSTFDKIGRSYGIFVDASFNIYVSDNDNNRVTLWYNGNNTVGALIAGGYGAGTAASQLNSPWGIHVNSIGSLYVADRANHRIQRWDPGATDGLTIAGDSGGLAGPYSYLLNNPTAVILDSFGSLYILDSGNSRVQKWLSGAIAGTTVLSATFSTPLGMTLSATGDLYVADTSNHRIASFRLFCPITTTSSPPSTQTTVPLCVTAAWNSTGVSVTGSMGTAGNSATFLSSPYDLAFDKYQQMYVCDFGNSRVQQYTFGSDIGRTVAGISSSAGSSLAQLNGPSAIYIDNNDYMYILDTNNYRVLKWAIGDLIGTVVINGRGSGTTLDKIGASYAMYFLNQTNVFISECGNNRVTKWTILNNTAGELVAGGAGAGSTAEKLSCPWGIYVDGNLTMFIVDQSNHRVQKWFYGVPYGITIAGQSAVSGSWSFQLASPTAIGFDRFGYMYIMDAGNARIQRWQIGMTYGITIIQSTMTSPNGMRWDYLNNFYVADTSAHRIAIFYVACPTPSTTTTAYPTQPANLACQTGMFNSSWTIVAGAPAAAGSTALSLSTPYDVFVDGNLNVYVADYGNNRVQYFQPGALSGDTIAGYTLAGGASLSQLISPTAIFVDLSGVMYIADSANYRVQKWLPKQPLGFAVAGGRGVGTTLDKIGIVYGLFVDRVGKIFVSENTNHRVTLWYPFNTTAGEIVAGVSVLGSTPYHLNSPYGVFVDANNTIFVVDRGNHRVQAWVKGVTYGMTVAGATGITGTNSSLLNSPTAITFDSNNFMYILDAGNNRVQRFAPGSLVADTIIAMTFSTPRGMRLDNVGNLYIVDSGNHRVLFFRCVYNVSTTTTIPTVPMMTTTTT